MLEGVKVSWSCKRVAIEVLGKEINGEFIEVWAGEVVFVVGWEDCSVTEVGCALLQELGMDAKVLFAATGLDCCEVMKVVDAS